MSEQWFSNSCSTRSLASSGLGASIVTRTTASTSYVGIFPPFGVLRLLDFVSLTSMLKVNPDKKGKVMALRLDEPVKKIKMCSFQRLYDNLDASDQHILNGWIEVHVTPYKIFQALKRDGHSIGRQTVYEHLNGWCICGS